MPSPGDWGGIKFVTEISSGSILSFIYIANATEAIYCDKCNLTITNSIITGNLQRGIYIKNSSPIIKRLQIVNNGNGALGDGGVYFEDSELTLENCTVLNSSPNDFILFGTSNVTTLNSTFDDDKVLAIGPSYQFTVKWYLDVLVTEEDGVTPILGAIVYIENRTGEPIEGSPTPTNIDGFVRWIKVIEYTRFASPTRVYRTPHNITATHDEYYSGYAEPSIDSSMEVQINLTMIRRDLTTNSENITFSTPGIPIAGEDLTIFVKIHNIEIDDAHDVRVVVIDNAPEGSKEIHNSTISEIKGNSSKNAIDVWQPTPGTHIIDVLIDPYNEVKEINSNPLIQAEENNNASIILNVNARPLVNITEPENNTKIKGTVYINGTAYDDARDDTWNPFNNITRVDIRLEGYDWIELYPFVNVFPNILLGNWSWFYNWDTTQWNSTPLSDGNYTINARAWDNYHFSHIYVVNITINNTGANSPPIAVISAPANFSAFNVSDVITFNGSESNDAQSSPEDLNFTWDFDDTVDSNGDGNYRNDEDAFGNVTNNAYERKGIFNVTLIVTDEGGLNDTTWITIVVWNHRPVANLSASNTTVYENQTVTFNASGSYDLDGVIISYLWNFDDGTILVTTWPVVTMNHSFNESRIFNVTLTVTDNNVTSNTTWVLIDVLSNAAPVADIEEPNNLDAFSVNETIIFNGSSSYDPNDEDVEYYWDFGDGNTYLENKTYFPDGEYDGKTTHYYSELAPFPTFSYTIILEVRDDEGLSDTDAVTIFVNNYPPVAIATSNVTTVPTNQDITFDGTDSYDPPPSPTTITYYWDFDDGNFSEDGNVSFHFIKSGVYNVTLTVSDGFANDTDWIIITITNRAPIIEDVSTSPDSPKINEEINFNVTASDDDGTVVKYEWDFGEGYQDFTSVSGNTTHSFDTKGEYTIRVRITDDDGAVNTTDIVVHIVNSPPEVTITFPTEGATVSGTVMIQGTSSDIDGTVDMVEARIDGGTWILVNDDSGDWSSWNLPWDTEDGVNNGQHTIYARAYDSEDYTEPPESISVTVDNIPTSIEVTADLDPSTVVAGGTVEVYGYVTYNTGEGVLAADVNIEIQSEALSWPTTTDSNGFYSTDITAPGEADSYTVTVRAEKEDFTPVQILKTLTVTALPDLAVSATDIDFNPSAPFSGETVQITITVRNLGDVDANNILVNAYDGDPNAGGDQIEPKGSDTVNVQKGGSANVYLIWDTTGKSGEHFLYILLDPNNSIDESNENNNQASRAINVLGKSDFAIDSEDISFSNPDPREGDKISILVKIYNEGDESGTVKYEVYDGDPDADGVLIDSGQEPISANGDETVTVEWTIEESGDHDIYVVLDPDDEIDESDENNNKAFNTISVESKPGEEEVPIWFIALTAVIVVIVILLLYFLRFKERGPKEEKELPLAKVVKKDAKGTEKAGEGEKEEATTLLDSHGGVRI
jgi:PKD repeat protein